MTLNEMEDVGMQTLITCVGKARYEQPAKKIK